MNLVNVVRSVVYGANALSVGVNTPLNISSGICASSLQSQNGMTKLESPLSLRMVCSK